MTHHQLREQLVDLLMELTEASGADLSEHRACMRHLSLGALNLAEEADAEALMAASGVLPWLGVFLGGQREKVSGTKLAEMICHHGLVRQLPEPVVRRRICAAFPDDHSQIRRTPSGKSPVGCTKLAQNPDTPITDGTEITPLQVLKRLVADDRRIGLLAEANEHDRRDALLDDAGLLATALQLRGCDQQAGLDDALPKWRIDAPSKPLEVFARFERVDFDAVPPEWRGLDDRARRFEQSLAEHLGRHGMLTPVRAALAFSPAVGSSDPDLTRVRRFLSTFSAFAADPALLELAVALIGARHLCVDVVRGAAPLDALSGWAQYLWKGCSRLAESRDITLREATNFAHYALHLVNLCDLSVADGVELTDPMRRALMDVEDEIKEFVTVGRKSEAPDRPVELFRYEKARFDRAHPRAQLADRLARLGGAWRAGHRPGPHGCAPRPDHPLIDTCLELVNGDDTWLDATNHLLRRAHLLGIDRLESWPAHRTLLLVQRALHLARHCERIDTDRPFTVDLTPLANWVTEGDGQDRGELLEVLLETRRDDHNATNPALTPHADEQFLTVQFHPDENLQALLTLLASTDDDGFRDTLRRRVDNMLRRAQNDSTDVPGAPAPSPPGGPRR